MKKVNFWKELKKPFFVLAPMDDVTDVVFREVVTKTKSPDVFFTEFTNVDGLMSKGYESQITRLLFTKNQKPIVAQLWGINPENYFKTAKLIEELGFDGIDLNFGCPARHVTKNGACSALINNPVLAAEIIEAVKKGAPNLPVSVKTRIGYKGVQTEEWIGFLLSQNLDALTIHGRVAREMSKFPANWEEIKKARELRDQLAPDTIIIGNGDVRDYEDGVQKAKESMVEGIMIGRGIFSDLWCFAQAKEKKEQDIKQMLDLLLYHMHLFIETWGKTKNFLILRRFFKIYVSRFPGAADLRNKLMQSKNIEEVEKMVEEYLASPYKTSTIGN